MVYQLNFAVWTVSVLNHGKNLSQAYRSRLFDVNNSNKYVFVQTKSKLFKNNNTGEAEFIMSTHSLIRYCFNTLVNVLQPFSSDQNLGMVMIAIMIICSQLKTPIAEWQSELKQTFLPSTIKLIWWYIQKS